MDIELYTCIHDVMHRATHNMKIRQLVTQVETFIYIAKSDITLWSV